MSYIVASDVALYTPSLHKGIPMRIYDINRHDSKEIIINRVFFDDLETQFPGAPSVIMMQLVLKANQRTKKQGRVFVPRGAILTSIPKIAIEAGMAETKARSAIKLLEDELFLRRTIYNRTTLFTVRDYDYATYTDKEETRADSKRNSAAYYKTNKHTAERA